MSVIRRSTASGSAHSGRIARRMGLYPDAAPVPDAKTIWPNREQLTRPGAPGRAFTRSERSRVPR